MTSLSSAHSKALIKSANEYLYPGHADPSAYGAIHLSAQMKRNLFASQSALSGTLRKAEEAAHFPGLTGGLRNGLFTLNWI